eukprot:549556_1
MSTQLQLMCDYWLNTMKSIFKFHQENNKVSKFITIIGLSATFLLIRKLIIKQYRSYHKYPPGPVGLPVVGSLISYINTSKFHKYIGKSYHPAASVSIGLTMNLIFINDKDLILELGKHNRFKDRPNIFTTPMKGWLPPSIININGSEWIHRRKLLQTSLLRITNSNFMTEYVQHNIKNRIIIPSITHAINTNNIWIPRDVLQNFAFNTVYAASFGGDKALLLTDHSYKKYKQAFEKVTSILMTISVSVLLSTKLFHFLMNKYYKKPYEEIHNIVSKWITESKENDSNEFKSYTNEMLSVESISKENALVDIFTMFMVGTGSVAESIEYMLCLAAKYPNVQNKIYDELCNILGDNSDKIDIKILNKANYLRAFVEECWRCADGILLSREIKSDFKFEFKDKYGNDDYYILPKGSQIVFNNIYCFKNEEYEWKCANRFDVNNYLDENDKFMKTNKNKSNVFELNVFGPPKGRDCAGQMLARNQILLCLAILLHKYKFCGPNGIDDTDFKMGEYLKPST